MRMEIGETACFSKTITEHDVYAYAGITGDFNSVHVNDVEAKKTVFGKRIVHGLLAGGLISTVLGTLLPGDGTIYLEQNMKFIKPVYFGDTCKAIVTVKEAINEKKGIYRMETIVVNQNEEVVVAGYAVVKIA